MLWEILKAGRTNNSEDLFTRLAARRVSVSKRGYIVLPHDTGAFNATAKGNNIIWENNGEIIQGETCAFNITNYYSTVRIAFDEALEKLEIKNNNALKADLSDLGGKITYYLSLGNCKNITGDLADLGGKITNTLSLGNCKNITGDLADLGGKITYYLNLSDCTKITGDLADLGGKITNTLILYNCKNISGVYSGIDYPTIINLSYTGVSAEEMDQNLINLNENRNKKGTFTANGMSRTAASDAAVAGLTAKGWTITGLTKV